MVSLVPSEYTGFFERRPNCHPAKPGRDDRLAGHSHARPSLSRSRFKLYPG